MYYQKITVSPIEANKYLVSSLHNRPMKKRRVASIADDIVNGKWTESPAPIVFDKEGHLIDGQHRMAAILKANKPVSLWACYDCDNNTVIDRGIPRSTGDALYMRGVLSKDLSNPAVIAIVKRYDVIKNGKRFLSDDYIADFILGHADALAKTLAITSMKGGILCKCAGFRTAIFAALDEGIDSDILSQFTYVVHTGFMNCPEQSSAVVLRNYLMDNRYRGDAGSNRIAAYTQTAIKDFVAKTPRTKKYIKATHFYINNVEV